MPDDTPLDQSQLLALEYAKEASERVRKIIVLLIVASVVTFIAWWNQYAHGWTTARFQVAQDALSYLCEQAELLDSSAPWIGDACRGGYQKELTAPQREMSQEFMKDWRFTRKQLERHIQDLQDQYVSGVLKINVPFFGLTSDVNDLGILSGIALVALLSLFLFTIWREEQNIRQLFVLAAGRSNLSSVLELFAMTQVFTIPPWNKEPGAKRVTAFFALMPAAAYLLVASYDTYQFYSAPHYWRGTLNVLTIVIELCALTVIAIISGFTMQITRRIDAVWRAAWTKARESDIAPVATH